LLVEPQRAKQQQLEKEQEKEHIKQQKEIRELEKRQGEQ
jgi:hypothetical protein